MGLLNYIYCIYAVFEVQLGAQTSILSPALWLAMSCKLLPIPYLWRIALARFSLFKALNW